MRPHFGMEVRNPDGQVLRKLEPDPVRPVLSRETSATLAAMLENVISRGTGKMAHVDGYRLAGKTGTAQKNVNGRVSSDKHTAAFVGFGPVDKPQIAVAIVIDEPGPSVPYYGGQIAAPVFGVVMGDLLRYLEIPPTEPKIGKPGGQPLPVEEMAEVPSLVNLPVDEARRVAVDAGFQLRVDGAYPVVTGQVPPAGARLPRGSTLIVEATEEGTALSGEVRVPDLTGKTLRESAGILAGMNLRLAPEGTGLAAGQDPAPGTLVAPGSSVRVTFRTPAASP